MVEYFVIAILQNLLLRLSVKGFWKAVNIRQS